VVVLVCGNLLICQSIIIIFITYIFRVQQMPMFRPLNFILLSGWCTH